MGKNYSSYNNKYTKGEERYGDNGSSSNSRSSRTDEKDNRSQKRKSRWDVEGRTRDNHHPVMEQKERKSRSRSPINNKCQDPKNCYLNGFISTPKTPAASGIQIKMIQPIVVIGYFFMFSSLVKNSCLMRIYVETCFESCICSETQNCFCF